MRISGGSKAPFRALFRTSFVTKQRDRKRCAPKLEENSAVFHYWCESSFWATAIIINRILPKAHNLDMSLPSSFTFRPLASGPATSNESRTVTDDCLSKGSIHFCFSGTDHAARKSTSNVGFQVSTDSQPPFPPLDERFTRRAFRVSPFEPMVHLRRMPRQGTISPLKLGEYEVERRTDGLHLVDDLGSSPSTLSSRPPLEEVHVPGTSSGCDHTLSSNTASENTPTDYKTLFLQTEKELKALQKLQERTLGENHLLRSRLMTIMKRRSQPETEPTRTNSRRLSSMPYIPHPSAPLPSRPLLPSGFSASLLSPMKKSRAHPTGKESK